MTEADRKARQRVHSRNFRRKQLGLALDAPLREQGLDAVTLRAKKTARTALRDARIRRQTPTWLSTAERAEIEGVYHCAAILGKITGKRWHVDHIVPLRGKSVRGLHVPWNLQVLEASENIRKGNRLAPGAHND